MSRSSASINCELTANGSEVIVWYEFDRQRLYSIQTDIFFPDTAALAQFQRELMYRYNNRYGEVSENGGFLVWKGKAGKDSQVQFALADESFEFGRPKLSLTIYNFGY